ncbi:coenzyme F420-0:L-glutamate ligase [Senegalia massiliensis]|uniref:Glutamate ligase n=1 Tax=Senegalia massiliensis TaxID=1720316 RepID=A0A845QY53_9CLOT|nr:coenzyme F420-0:L-glutamate ligase [Senegalia massiliensis]NBI06446.1 glutamate ligase [Senegalia massiliensis]
MINLQTILNFPIINEGDIISDIIMDCIKYNKITLQNNDILCVASKIVSIAESRILSLESIIPSPLAYEIHKKVPRKDPRIIQQIINETGAADGSRVEVSDNYIGAWLPNGMRLTSAGIDKFSEDKIILLPINPDESAKNIGEKILNKLGINVAVIITDSDGRIEKRGATQIAIGIYGLDPLRTTSFNGKIIEETICDMFAASAGILMGQRGNNKPVVIISGYEFDFNQSSCINSALAKNKD